MNIRHERHSVHEVFFENKSFQGCTTYLHIDELGETEFVQCVCEVHTQNYNSTDLPDRIRIHKIIFKMATAIKW